MDIPVQPSASGTISIGLAKVPRTVSPLLAAIDVSKVSWCYTYWMKQYWLLVTFAIALIAGALLFASHIRSIEHGSNKAQQGDEPRAEAPVIVTFDRERQKDLLLLTREIGNFYFIGNCSQKGGEEICPRGLPLDLDQLRAHERWSYLRAVDPESSEPYLYEPLDDASFIVCATPDQIESFIDALDQEALPLLYGEGWGQTVIKQRDGWVCLSTTIYTDPIDEASS